jgi:hypothetical protein
VSAVLLPIFRLAIPTALPKLIMKFPQAREVKKWHKDMHLITKCMHQPIPLLSFGYDAMSIQHFLNEAHLSP